MTEKYISGGGYPEVYHEDSSCPLSHGANLVAVQEEEIPATATACSGCANGITPNDIEKIARKND